MEINRIDTNLLKGDNSCRLCFKTKQKIVDALNVFPVPDGDTGTNMSLTMDQAVKELTEISSTDLKRLPIKLLGVH